MLNSEDRKPVTVLNYLVEVTSRQEPWITNGFCRIVEKGRWTEADVDKLGKVEALDLTFSDSVYVPLSITKGSLYSNGDNAVSLVSVCHIVGVNRLPSTNL